MEALAVIWAPVRTLAGVAEERRVLLGFVIVALSAALGLIFSSVLVFSGYTQAQFELGGAELSSGLENFPVLVEIFSLISAVVSPFIWWLLVAGLMQLVTRFFGGTGPFSGMLAVVGVAYVPLLIGSIVQFPITSLQLVLGPENPATGDPTAIVVTLLSSLIGLAFQLWHAALVVIGAAFARRVSYGESVGSCAISCGGCLGLILIVSVVFGILVAVLVGAGSSTGLS